MIPPPKQLTIPFEDPVRTWLDHPFKQAKYLGRRRELHDIKGIIIHRLSRGEYDAGVRYVQNPDPRKVSWHITVGKDSLCRHAPLDRVTYHCKYPSGTNLSTIGIEIEGPMGSLIPESTCQRLRDLVFLLKELCPSITYIASHSYMDKKAGIRKPARRDPGKELDWSWLEHLRLEILK